MEPFKYHNREPEAHWNEIINYFLHC